MRKSPKVADARVSITPPASICAAALMALDGGSVSLRVSTDDIDQLMDARIRAMAPSVSTGAPPTFSVRLINTATPPIPIRRAIPRRAVKACVRRKKISDSAMNAGIVASTTAAIPEGTLCSAQNSRP